MKLSIITVNLNNRAGLEKTIQSVIEQSFEDFEFIVVDGASVDGSIDILSIQNGAIDRWISEPDDGIYEAMNKGIRMAKGEYCLFLNSGDWLADDQVLSKIFEKEQNADILSGDIVFFDTRENQIRWWITPPDILTAKTFFEGSLPHQATFIKRKLFDKYGFYNENLKIASDWLFFTETLLENHCTYQHYNGLVSYFNMDGISCSTNSENLLRDEKSELLQQKYPRFIADYNRLKQLEEHEKSWKNSKESIVFRFLKNAGVIKTGIFIIKLINFIKRKFPVQK